VHHGDRGTQKDEHHRRFRKAFVPETLKKGLKGRVFLLLKAGPLKQSGELIKDENELPAGLPGLGCSGVDVTFQEVHLIKGALGKG